MANEITVTASLLVSNGLYGDSRTSGRAQFNQATADGNAGTQTITTTYGAIDLGGVTTAGYAYIRNISTTNFVEIGTEVGAAFAPCIKLLPREVALFRIGAPLFAKADTASVKIDVLILAQ
jgi:hypothetical protein